MSRLLLLLGVLAPAALARPLDIQAHRGGVGPHARESLAAFAHALGTGATTLEMDAQVTRDGVAVIRHDPLLDGDRCRDARGRAPARRDLRLMDAAEIADLRCDGEPVALLADVLALARAAAPVRVNVEVKHQDGAPRPVEAAATIVARALRHASMVERALVQSFHPEALRAARLEEPRLRTAILVRDPDRHAQRLAESRADVLMPRRDGLTRAHVRRAHDLGVEVIPWVIDDPRDARTLVAWGVDGLVTDHPERLARELLAPEPPPEPGGPVMNPVRIASLSLAAALALAPAVPAQESAPETPAPPALRLHDIRTIAVSPFTSGGNVDTFCASIFTTRARDLPGIDRVMDPLELRVSIPDGQPFHIEPVLPTLLAEARGRGADALAVGVGKWYDWGFRLEIKLVEVNRGEVVWSSERASGISFSGPSAKREVVREMIDELRRDLNGKRRVARR